jgi:hypothetical protein
MCIDDQKDSIINIRFITIVIFFDIKFFKGFIKISKTINNINLTL